MTHTNRLIHETSPYLLQHAHNPVDWRPFGPDALELAKLENKPMLISIGYSSCHWCHVMEHESFEDDDIAGIMNQYFVCVKVDREERPDVDHVYMDAVQQIHGNGGWPLNSFALPDGRPFWGGTYFRPEQWKQLLLNVKDLFQNRFDELEAQATGIVEGLARQNYIVNERGGDTATSIDFKPVYALLHQAFDHVEGGMQGTPKFPMPLVLQFILSYGAYYKDTDAMTNVQLSLKKMASGGIYDQAGGGFSRYSTDAEWKVPHFEKMLYDNAQLISLYAAAFQMTGNKLYKEVIEQSIGFLDRELKSPEGFYYSALDADSEGEEGLFYTWTAGDFDSALGHYAELVGEYYGLGGPGLWENDRNILLRPESDELFAQQHYLSAEELASLIEFCRDQLLKSRSARPRPAMDDKMLTSWNALTISALIAAYVALGQEEYLQSATDVATFILTHLKRPDQGLFHTWKNGKSQIHAFLDDYAFTCEALLSLYSVTNDERWLNEAELLADYVVKRFYDTNSGFFWYSQNDDDQLFAQKIDIYDGVIPSGNSVMANVLNTLGIFLHNDEYLEKSRSMVNAVKDRFIRYPAAYANWANLALQSTGEQLVVAVVGPESVHFTKSLKMENSTGLMVFGSSKASSLPYFENRYVEGKTLIYICSGNQCLIPVETVGEANLLIKKGKHSPQEQA
ncbi:MAG: thioredoxin domain-containing protein [Bacteroidota bacterium]